MEVCSIEVSSRKGYCELQAQVRSDTARKPFLLRYCYPSAAQGFLRPNNGDAFLAAVLLPAMKTGETVEIPADVSPKLLHAVGEIQSVYRSWDKTLSKVQVKAHARDDQPMLKQWPSRRGLFFSCGVDSYYSLLKNLADHPDGKDTITDLIVLRGFDIPFWRLGSDIFRTILVNARRASGEFQKNMLPVATNLRDFGARFVSWPSAYHGAALASVGLTLESVFERIHIAASFSHDQLFPWGSHPALDPLWSTESLAFSHDGGEAKRVEKIRFIARFPIVTDTLRVCTYRPFSAVIYNCGVCEKCLRTMVALHMAGALQRCRTLPNSIDLRELRSISVAEDLRVYMEELVADLGSSGTDLAIKSALQEALSGSRPPRSTIAALSVLLSLAAYVPPLSYLWVRQWRALRRSPPSSISGLFRFPQ